MAKLVLLALAALCVALASCQDDAYSADELQKIAASKESHAFEAEVHKLMDIIINSLYSTSEIFLRELISNGSDALDKLRYYSISNKDLLGDGELPLEIKIRADPEANTLTITDTGIGMTKEEMVQNLGTIARSGTMNFIKSLQGEGSGDIGQIGQFGVGFYSAFLVADRVTVHSKSPLSDVQMVWEADSQQQFTVYEDPRGNTLGRGTSIVLHLKEDESEYLNDARLKALVTQYSQFIDFPIYLWESHEEAVQREEEAAEGEEEGAEEEDAFDVEEDDDEEEEEGDDEPGTIVVHSWERVNDLKPIWTRKPADIEEEEYNKFFQSLAKDIHDPLAHIHFKAEGDINFNALLFIPPRAPQNLHQDTDSTRDVKLYVKRVFITNDFAEVIPRYLSFLKGVVDSDDLQLNVSREMLQKNRLLASMKKKIVRKAVAMIQELAEDEDKYAEFWEQYSTSIKLGVLEDTTNRPRLEKLLRFHSSKTGELTGFEGYVERMKEGQKSIYFFAQQDDVDNLKKSPLLEKLLNKGFEVLFMTEPIDEYLFQMGGITKFEDYDVVNVAKENLKLDDGEEEEVDEEAVEEEFAPVVDFLKTTLGKLISRCKVSHRLTSSPSALTSAEWGWTANMERLTKSQPLADKSMAAFYRAQKILEINPTHPIIVEIRDRLANDQREGLDDVARLLFDTALLSSGFDMEDPHTFAQRIHRVMHTSLGIQAPPAAADAAEDAEEGHDEL